MWENTARGGAVEKCGSELELEPFHRYRQRSFDNGIVALW